jgi:hypothetical protein
LSKHKNKVIRNISLFSAAIFCLGALIIYIALTRRTVLIMPPETPNEVALRQSPDNPYFEMAAAVRMLPRQPVVTPEEKAEYKRWTASGESTVFLGGFANLELRNDSPKLQHYLEDCDLALVRARNALTKPNFRLPIAWKDFETYSYDDFAYPSDIRAVYGLSSFMEARAMQLTTIPGKKDEAVAWLVDSLRYRNLISSDNPEGIGGVGLAPLLLDRASKQATIAALHNTLVAVESLHRQLRPPVSNLEFHWRVADKTARLRKRAPIIALGQNARKERLERMDQSVVDTGINWVTRELLFSTGLSQASRFAAEHRDDYRTALELPYPQFRSWQAVHPELASPSAPLRGISRWLELDKTGYSGYGYGLLTPSWKVQFLAEQYAWVDATYSALEAILALELYHRDRGGYPDTLEGLVPEYLPAIPNDAFTGLPLSYHKTNRDFWLSATGPDNAGDRSIQHAIGFTPFHEPTDSPDKKQ